jgi:hypothetical protein
MGIAERPPEVGRGLDTGEGGDTEEEGALQQGRF